MDKINKDANETFNVSTIKKSLLNRSNTIGVKDKSNTDSLDHHK